jgi:hypothetical protein
MLVIRAQLHTHEITHMTDKIVSICELFAINNCTLL